MNRFAIPALVVAALALAVWSFWPEGGSTSTQSRDRAENASTITVFEARPAIEVVRLDAVGSAEALRSITLYPPSAGEVVAVHFSAGDEVEQGQVLIELDARDERLALELAETRLADAERLLDRYTRGGSEAAFTPTQMDAARTAVAEARIARDRARIALDDRRLVAPFTGRIGITEIDPGDRVSESTVIATLDDRSELMVRFEVPEAFLGQLSPGTEVELSPWSALSREVIGRVAEVDSRIDPSSRTFVIRARLNNEADRWRPGMGFQVRLDLVGESYVQVPELALQWGANGAYVWTVDEQSRARRVLVTLVQRKDGQVLLDGDIDVGQAVVLEGVQKMAEGRLVEVIDDEFLDGRDGVQAYLDALR
ncbi:efflux RND transporter periplasmic adaptor subunit [Wenzhouxiangella marina]|uniref:RND family efflux transporter, MFP subunit n=1 Tax=Wenzhouxiangella marina TaxID=1579979 RepID=A0A0K0XUD3_9GAMM|nr:efflux RND transporter periplasmic adaptor subunit [Wenzhouxiangella marina]AKS41226.1 RND family efflux transporter, MFP subunit [Wenzhouxiangella marina]MBB6088106.1 RND family efflux transporter MFP subunit [Wenzhouxiangella marina]